MAGMGVKCHTSRNKSSNQPDTDDRNRSVREIDTKDCKSGNTSRSDHRSLGFNLVLTALSRFGCFRKEDLLRERSLSFSHHNWPLVNHKAEVFAPCSLEQRLHILTGKPMLVRHSPRSLLDEIIPSALLTNRKIDIVSNQIDDEKQAARPEPLDNAIDTELEVLEVVEAHAYACDVEIE